ncbi:MAG: class I SAM-dependent methyltransferase [Nanoarchaeota archaeon]|nr:class I SAM-dependent methyltransferase [Nanoarchaeota archaeon]MBU1029693.1 class I SAM-dependent methyltransferase [Nanoarchaeota archaeon]
MDTYYDEIFVGYDDLHRKEQEKKLRIIANNLKVSPSDKLLDVGCGTGFSKEFFDCEWIGVDPAKNLLKKSLGKTVCASAESLPFSDDSFDIVISVTAIHNFSNFKKGFLEMKRVGKEKFVFSILKCSKSFGEINKFINSFFKISEVVEEEKDVIFFCFL